MLMNQSLAISDFGASFAPMCVVCPIFDLCMVERMRIEGECGIHVLLSLVGVRGTFPGKCSSSMASFGAFWCIVRSRSY